MIDIGEVARIAEIVLIERIRAGNYPEPSLAWQVGQEFWRQSVALRACINDGEDHDAIQYSDIPEIHNLQATAECSSPP